jgi:ribosomal protein L37AE/L43A
MKWTENPNYYCNKCNKTYLHNKISNQGFSCSKCGRMKFFKHFGYKPVKSIQNSDYINIMEPHSFFEKKDSRE